MFIKIPSLEKEINFDPGFVAPLTLSRHNAAVSRNASRFGGGSAVTLLPKVVGSSVPRIRDASKNLLQFYKQDDPIPKRDPSTITKQKTEFVFPQIGLKKHDDELEELKLSKQKAKNPTANESQIRAKASTVQLPGNIEDDSAPSFNGFPRRATTTANGKAHLIGPTNKMDIIADYSKALQSGLISYNEYIKKLSVLSLHKVPIGNSIQRHFHLIR